MVRFGSGLSTSRMKCRKHSINISLDHEPILHVWQSTHGTPIIVQSDQKNALKDYRMLSCTSRFLLYSWKVSKTKRVTWKRLDIILLFLYTGSHSILYCVLYKFASIQCTVHLHLYVCGHRLVEIAEFHSWSLGSRWTDRQKCHVPM